QDIIERCATAPDGLAVARRIGRSATASQNIGQDIPEPAAARPSGSAAATKNFAKDVAETAPALAWGLARRRLLAAPEHVFQDVIEAAGARLAPWRRRRRPATHHALSQIADDHRRDHRQHLFEDRTADA